MFSTIFLTILSVSGPSSVISAGLLILIGTLLHYSSRRKNKSRSNQSSHSTLETDSSDLKQNLILTTKLLKELEQRETVFQNWFENSFAKLNQQKSQITTLLHSADQTAIQLNKMIDAFEQTFLAPQASVVSVFNDLESSLKNEVQQFEHSVASLQNDPLIKNEITKTSFSNEINRGKQINYCLKKGINSDDLTKKWQHSQNDMELSLDYYQTRKAI